VPGAQSVDQVIGATTLLRARVRAAQNQLMMALWRDGAVSDLAYAAFIAHGDQVDADVAALQILYGSAPATEADLQAADLAKASTLGRR
jgi:hypothetical protein